MLVRAIANIGLQNVHMRQIVPNEDSRRITKPQDRNHSKHSHKYCSQADVWE